MELPLARQGGRMVDVPTNATWALWLPGTTSGGKEKETDLELLCFNGASSRNRVAEKHRSTPSGFGNMEVIHCYHRINRMPCRISYCILKSTYTLLLRMHSQEKKRGCEPATSLSQPCYSQPH